MSIELLGNVELSQFLWSIIALTVAQSSAIYNRDNKACVFPFDHICKGKLSLHHVENKADDPNNIVVVCRSAHWNHLHNGASEEEKEVWRNELSKIAIQNTKKAKARGWIFPE